MKSKAKPMLTLLAGMALFSCGGGSNVFESMADKNSYEACRFEVSQNLDKGNYDAVLRSTCATPLDRGAAYFGKAGFDIKDVIDRLIENTQGEDPINVYLKALVPSGITEEKLTFLDRAVNEYNSIAGTNRDASFYLSLVEAMRGLTTLKVVIESGTGTSGISQCDRNGNGVPDEVDATACALGLSENTYPGSSGTCQNISGANYSNTGEFYYPGKDSTGTYIGMTITISLSGSGSDSGCPTRGSTGTYKKVFYKGSDNKYRIATTLSQECNTSLNQEWPCPVVREDKRDMVNLVSENFTSMVDSIEQAIISSRPELKDKIQKIKRDACGDDGVCTAEEIKNYIQKIKK